MPCLEWSMGQPRQWSVPHSIVGDASFALTRQTSSPPAAAPHVAAVPFPPSQFSQLRLCRREATAAERESGRRRFGSIFIFCGDWRRAAASNVLAVPVPPSQFLQVGSRCRFDRRDDNDDCGGSALRTASRACATSRVGEAPPSEGSWSDACIVALGCPAAAASGAAADDVACERPTRRP